MKVYGDSSSINELIETAMSKLKGLVDSSTVIGDKMELDDGITIIPVSKVSVGFVVGGGEYADLSSRRVSNHFPMAGGSSGGISVSPIGFLIKGQDNFSFVSVENERSMPVAFVEFLEKIMNKFSKEEKK